MYWGVFGIVFGNVCLNHGLNSLSAEVVFLKDWPEYSVIYIFGWKVIFCRHFLKLAMSCFLERSLFSFFLNISIRSHKMGKILKIYKITKPY